MSELKKISEDFAARIIPKSGTSGKGIEKFVAEATEIMAGKVRMASSQDIQEGTNGAICINPSQLKDALSKISGYEGMFNYYANSIVSIADAKSTIEGNAAYAIEGNNAIVTFIDGVATQVLAGTFCKGVYTSGVWVWTDIEVSRIQGGDWIISSDSPLSTMAFFQIDGITPIKIGYLAVGTSTGVVTLTSDQTITGIKTFNTEPQFGIAKTTAAINNGVKIASEAQVYLKFDRTGGELSGDITIAKSTGETPSVTLKAGTVDSKFSANSSGIFLYRTYTNRLAYDNSANKWYVYKSGIAKELGLNTALELSYDGTVSGIPSSTIQGAIDFLKTSAADGGTF